MIKLLAKIGRFNTVVVITIIASAASAAVATGAILILNQYGLAIRLHIAIPLAAAVALVVAPPISWVLVGMMLRIYRIEEKMRNIASYDSLTGLLSRHAFFESANRSISLANRHRAAFAVLIIDLDHFKSINDRFGHPAGDAVLRLFADVVNSVARRSDIVGRLGGEEFAMLLPSTNTSEALDFCQRLHGAIGKAVLKYQNSVIRYTVSIGLTASSIGSLDSIENLLAHADLALYQAKRDGRNQTAVFNYATEKVVAS
ncbi:MAG: GGDEF domain-containing protein [Gammaproteobacteria bacterium]|nr:GGDEF domain-containing protein [Gammaproteobacteria bacterium]